MKEFDNFLPIQLTPSHVIQFLYCARFTWFEHVLAIPQYEEKNYKVMRGRHLHTEKLERNKDYLRKRLGVKRKWLDQYMSADGLRGRIDEVLELNDATLAPLDYKFAEWKEKIFNTYKLQLYCYAFLIEQNFQRKVNKGFLVYIRSKNKVIEVNIPDSAKSQIKESVKAIGHIIDNNYFPKATKYKGRCVNCTYRNLCIK